MDDYKQHKSFTAKDHLEEASCQILEEGLNKVCELEQSLEQHINDLSWKIKEKPMTSVLIAAGIGYIWAKLTK
ncbi:hypothetical protein [Legionella sp. PC997]|uniref:hypothetical protein n=1 Tax=Legionella sp. PC997 TaxID=2755562 RepID=UPI0015FE00DB|nr:hypothetical protein [Legionella sp. PC997]QMT59798.1 hypothetical protein HBNCFIEN_01165 [Legionella sp. PC997]